MTPNGPEGMSLLDRWAPAWVFIAIVVGLVIGREIPGIPWALMSLEVAGVPLPIAVGMFLMLIPPLARLRLDQPTEIGENPPILILAGILTWVVGPALMFTLAWIFLGNQPAIRDGLILLGLARCLSLVWVWTDLADGDRRLTDTLVMLNASVQLALFALLGWFYLELLPRWLGLPHPGDVPFFTMLGSVLVFVGIPMLLGILTRILGESLRGRDWYEGVALPRMAPWTMIGLLYTVVLIFSMRGLETHTRPGLLVDLAVPLAIYFAVMVLLGVILSRAFGHGYGPSVLVGFVAAGSNFAMVMAVTVGTFGAASDQVLAAAVGPLIEVPVFLALVYFVLWAGPKLFRGETTTPGHPGR